MEKLNIPELLSPVGNMDSMYMAVNNGADAIYLGGKDFNARSSAQNFSYMEIDQIVNYASKRGVKVYITVNTLYKNKELSKVTNFIKDIYNIGVDAFIFQDIGVANIIKNNLDIPIHISTQASIHSKSGVKFIEKCGFDRVVLSRELSLEEIKDIVSNSNIEIEVFVHGALCVSYSGQCLMSSLIGGRSGNRGKCAQACRLGYKLIKNDNIIKNGYLLSPKDVMTLDILEDIVKTNVKSLKIEGRMKNPEYVGIVTKAYREQLDRISHGESIVDPEAIKDITQIFNRGGSFTKGYFVNYSSKDMMSIETPKNTGSYIGRVINYEKPKKDGEKGKCIIFSEEELIPGDGIEIWTSKNPHVGTNISKKVNASEKFIINIEGNIEKGNLVYRSFDKELMDRSKKLINNKRQLEITGTVIAQISKPLELNLFYKNINICKYGDIVVEATNKPLSSDDLINKLSKTGNTPYKIKYINNKIDDNIYINISSVNNLRREALEEFDKLFSKNIDYIDDDIQVTWRRNPKVDKKVSIEVKTIEQFNACLNKNIDRIYFKYNKELINDIKNIVYKTNKNNIKFFIALPNISRTFYENKLKEDLKYLQKFADGFLVSNYGQLEILEEINNEKKVQLNYTFNVFNNVTLDFFRNKGYGVTLSEELNINELEKMGGPNSELIIHGRQIVMSTSQCPAGLYDANKENSIYCKLRYSKDEFSLEDKKGEIFPITRDCNNCIAYILNSKILFTLNKVNDLKNIPVQYLRLSFDKESALDVDEIVDAYINAIFNNNIDNSINEKYQNIGITNGHFYRGVE